MIYAKTNWQNGITPRSKTLFNARETAITGAKCCCLMQGTFSTGAYSNFTMRFGAYGTPAAGTFYNSLGLPYTDYIKADYTNTYNEKFYVPEIHSLAFVTLNIEITEQNGNQITVQLYYGNTTGSTSIQKDYNTVSVGDIISMSVISIPGKDIYAYIDSGDFSVNTRLTIACI